MADALGVRTVLLQMRLLLVSYARSSSIKSLGVQTLRCSLHEAQAKPLAPGATKLQEIYAPYKLSIPYTPKP